MLAENSFQVCLVSTFSSPSLSYISVIVSLNLTFSQSQCPVPVYPQLVYAGAGSDTLAGGRDKGSQKKAGQLDKSSQRELGSTERPCLKV